MFRLYLQGVMLHTTGCVAASLCHICLCDANLLCVTHPLVIGRKKMDKLICCGTAKLNTAWALPIVISTIEVAGWDIPFMTLRDIKNTQSFLHFFLILSPNDASTCCFVQPGFKLFLSASLSKNNQSNRTS